MHDTNSKREDAVRQPSFGEVLAARMARRDVLRMGAALVATAGLPIGGCAVDALRGAPDGPPGSLLGFTPVTPSDADAVRVPAGYEATVLGRWGDPIGRPEGMPAFRMDASNAGADQELQYGMHHDGMQYYPLPRDSRNAGHGLLALNHEYEDEELLFPDGTANWTAEKTRKGLAAVGVTVVEARLDGNRWTLVRPSRYARRITAATPIAISGPAAGDPAMRTAGDPTGRLVLGTFAGCAHGWTPWGTYLTCEENWHFAFTHRGKPTADQARYRVGPGPSYRWALTEERFDVERHPNEPNRFGWVVEIDPYDPQSRPVKRTALGRIKHEGAAPSIGADGRIAFYMGDDEGFEYVYKFVTRDAWNPADRAANRTLLDHGTLYVARFDADGSGTWLPLVHGVGPLTAANGFASQADVLVRTRQAADAVGATPMDRPEWTAVHPVTREVYCTLTGNPDRGRGTRPGANVANPRAPNPFGHIVRWREAGNDVAATRFAWDIFAFGGVAEGDGTAGRRGTRGDAFGSPDGLAFDPRGILWVGTDMSPSVLNRGEFAVLGNNQMHAVDPRDGTFRRFLTGPRGSEITGITFAPDGRSLFVNVQHPGEAGRSDPARPRALSNWPDFDPAGRPRSATLAIRRTDGGIIGT